ncbi:MAG TPA: hypothetical protein VN032_10090 [Thermoanaerobaculia bacterium]|nr:hypothetical protein [Thermoanaerobaculia bacterium]
MSYLLIDDNFGEHPKIRALGDKAFRTHVRALCYCKRFQTDGLVPAAVAAEFGGKIAVRRLVAAGIWKKGAGGFEIHDFLKHNWSKKQLEAAKLAQSEAGARGAKKRWANRTPSGEEAGPHKVEGHENVGGEGSEWGTPSGTQWRNDSNSPTPTPTPTTESVMTTLSQSAGHPTAASPQPKRSPSTKGRTREPFVAPEPNDVDAYLVERGRPGLFLGEAFVDHYAAIGWLVGKSPMRDWRAAVRTWILKRDTSEAPGRTKKPGRYDHYANSRFKPHVITGEDP